jgi:hypothetical protein
MPINSIDTSIYSTKQPEPINPLTALKESIDVRNAYQQNRNAVQENRNAVEHNKLIQEQTQGAHQGVLKSQFDNALQQMNNLNGILSPLAKNPNITQQEMRNAADNAVAIGALTPQVRDEIIKTWGEDTPENNRKTVLKTLFQIQDQATKLKLIYGNPTSVDTGAGKQFGNQSLTTGEFRPTNTVRNELSPLQKTENQTYIDKASGDTVTSPTGTLFNKYGDPIGTPLAPTQNPNQGIGGEVDPEEKELDQLLAEASHPPGSQPQPENVPTGSQLPIGTRTISRAPGVVESMKRAAESGDALRQVADSVPQMAGMLSQMEGLIKSGDFNSGPGAEKWGKALSEAQRLFGVKTERVANQEEFNKLAGLIVAEQFKAIGGTGTDKKYDASMGISPSTGLSNQGNERIIALLKGNTDAIKIKNIEWQKYKNEHGAGSYGEFSNEFNQSFDPRVFQSQHMSKNERIKMADSLSPAERAKFKSDYNQAIEKSWISK